MRKNLKNLAIILLVALLPLCLLTACNENTNSTYFPAVNVMKRNLEKAGYTPDITNNNYSSTGLYYEKDDNFIFFHKFTSIEDFDTFINNDEVWQMYQADKNGNYLIRTYRNDPQYGNIVLLATNQAINDAGIKLVEI